MIPIHDTICQVRLFVGLFSFLFSECCIVKNRGYKPLPQEHFTEIRVENPSYKENSERISKNRRKLNDPGLFRIN